jgi:hypothetical protein
MAQKWSKMVQNGPKWPKMAQIMQNTLCVCPNFEHSYFENKYFAVLGTCNIMLFFAISWASEMLT